MDTSSVILLYIDCLRAVLPFVVTWFFCDLITSTLVRAALGGKFVFKE